VSGIYRIELGNGNFYIGSAANPRKRKNDHLSGLQRGKHRNARMQNCFDKYGIFEFTLVEQCSKDDLLIVEQSYLDKHFGKEKNLNMCANASSPMLGRKHSDEARKKITAYNITRVHSPETRAKMRASAKRGVPLSPEHRAKISATKKNITQETRANMSAAQKGKKHSPETLAKMSRAKSGRKLTPEHRALISASWHNRRAKMVQL
jgi:group I intron endonuclease